MAKTVSDRRVRTDTRAMETAECSDRVTRAMETAECSDRVTRAMETAECSDSDQSDGDS